MVFLRSFATQIVSDMCLLLTDYQHCLMSQIRLLTTIIDSGDTKDKTADNQTEVTMSPTKRWTLSHFTDSQLIL